MRVFVSPLRKCIQTAAEILKSHPSRNTKDGLTIVLHPFLTDRVNHIDSIPVPREDLKQFTDILQHEHPGLHFDYYLMDKLERTNLWYLEILTDKVFKQRLLQEILEPGCRDSTDEKKTLEVLKRNALICNGLEQLREVLKRSFRVQTMLKDEILYDEDL